MGAAIEQSVMHLVTSAPVSAKDVKSTKDTDSQDSAFSDLMAREDEEPAPEKNAKTPVAPLPCKEKPQEIPVATQVELAPQNVPLDLEAAPLEEIGFPKVWAGKASKEEAPQKQKEETADLRGVETLDKRLGKKPIEDTVITRTAKTHEGPEVDAQILEEADTQEVVEVAPPPGADDTYPGAPRKSSIEPGNGSRNREGRTSSPRGENRGQASAFQR